MESPRPTKRQRVSGSTHGLATPPTSDMSPVIERDISSRPDEPNDAAEDDDNLLARATHILATESAALTAITTLYQTNSAARSSLKQAVNTVLTAQAAGGKLIACGVGKSAYIAQKLVATCKSLSISASFLHASEAVHGDLGDVKAERDVLLFVSFSGRTPELLNVLPHLSKSTKVIALTGLAERAEDCPLLDGREHRVLLPAPIPESEEVTFGVAAPTTSTTVALAVADMLALTIADEMHRSRTAEIFKRNHPGGAIGMAHDASERRKRRRLDGPPVLELPSPESLSGSDD